MTQGPRPYVPEVVASGVAVAGDGAIEPGLVTIALPLFNGEAHLREALESVAQQTYDHVELLVVDDASTDGSMRIVEEFARSHPGVRVKTVRNPTNLGLAENWNRCIELARGEYLKYVFQDDVLAPRCVEELVGTIASDPDATMAFCSRSIVLDGKPDIWTRLWLRRHRTLHTRFSTLDRLNPGVPLLGEYLTKDPFRNWIGEPTGVLIRTTAVRAVGGFDPRLRQLADVEMWLRLMCRGSVGFVDESLASFRVHATSTTSRNQLDGAAWLDPLWICDTLLTDPCLRGLVPNPAALRARAALRVLRGELMRMARRRIPAFITRFGELVSYFRARRVRRRS